MQLRGNLSCPLVRRLDLGASNLLRARKVNDLEIPHISEASSRKIGSSKETMVRPRRAAAAQIRLWNRKAWGVEPLGGENFVLRRVVPRGRSLTKTLHT
jgi:hypothetical protein